MKSRYHVLQPSADAVNKLRRHLNCHPIVAKILVNRHITDEAEAFSFLNPSLENFRPPFSLKDVHVAVERIYAAIIKREKILIFGDYDVDGITATTLLFEFFQYIGTDVSYYIPHRSKEGYGLQTDHIFNVAKPNKTDLIITVDCGSGSHEAIRAANSAGIDVIITDHHNLSGTLPPATAVINPKRPDCSAGFDDLAGVGVAYILLVCLRKHLRDNQFWATLQEPNLKQICDLVALGTVADMVPLVAENRILTKAGISVINSGIRTGLKALIQTCGINSHFIDAADIAYRLAPRLNAAGRVAHAETAVKLLRTGDLETAMDTAASLNAMNAQRHDIESRILKDIQFHLEKNPQLLNKRSIVLSHPDWNEGILGIVASRIVERHYRPVILISTQSGIGKGSARSIPGVDLYGVLSLCENSLESFGGHAMAAGLKIKVEDIQRFEEDFEREVVNSTVPDDFVQQMIIDHALAFHEISSDLIDGLESLKPFGFGNPEPLFLSKHIHVLSSKIVGKTHRQMVLQQSAGKTRKAINAIQFNIDPRLPLKPAFDQMTFRLRWNVWNGKKTEQIIVEET